MHKQDYGHLITIEEEGQICETADGTRIFVMETDEAQDFDRHDEGYPISRTALEHCCGWGVEEIHISETNTNEQYVFDLETYLNAREKPVFDENYLTAPLSTAN